MGRWMDWWADGIFDGIMMGVCTLPPYYCYRHPLTQSVTYTQPQRPPYRQEAAVGDEGGEQGGVAPAPMMAADGLMIAAAASPLAGLIAPIQPSSSCW